MRAEYRGIHDQNADGSARIIPCMNLGTRYHAESVATGLQGFRASGLPLSTRGSHRFSIDAATHGLHYLQLPKYHHEYKYNY